MKKCYTTPEVSMDSIENSIPLLADSSSFSTSSSLEGFVDDGDAIVW